MIEHSRRHRRVTCKVWFWPANYQLILSYWYFSHLLFYLLFNFFTTFKLLVEFFVELRIIFKFSVVLVLIELEMTAFVSIHWTFQVQVDIRKFILLLILNSKSPLKVILGRNYRGQVLFLFIDDLLFLLLNLFNFSYYWLVPAVVIEIFIFILRISFISWSIKFSFFYNYFLSVSIILFYIYLIKYVCYVCYYVFLTGIQTWECFLYVLLNRIMTWESFSHVLLTGIHTLESFSHVYGYPKRLSCKRWCRRWFFL